MNNYDRELNRKTTSIDYIESLELFRSVGINDHVVLVPIKLVMCELYSRAFRHYRTLEANKNTFSYNI